MRVGIIIKTKFKLTKVVKCTMMMNKINSKDVNNSKNICILFYIS